MRDWRLLSAGSSGFPHRFTCKHLVCTSWRQVGTSFIPPTDVRVHLFATVGHLRDRVGRDEEHVSSGIRCFLEKVRIGCKGFFVSIGNTLILIAFDWYISWFRSCIQLWTKVIIFGVTRALVQFLWKSLISWALHVWWAGRVVGSQEEPRYTEAWPDTISMEGGRRELVELQATRTFT